MTNATTPTTISDEDQRRIRAEADVQAYGRVVGTRPAEVTR